MNVRAASPEQFSGKRVGVCLPVDLGKSGGKIRPVVAIRDADEIHLKFEGSEEAFSCQNIRDTFHIDEEGLNGSIIEALCRASGQFDPSIPRFITVDTVGAGFKILNADGTVRSPLCDYLHPRAEEGMKIAEALTGGGKQEALRQIALATAGQSGVGVYNLYHLIALASKEAFLLTQELSIFRERSGPHSAEWMKRKAVSSVFLFAAILPRQHGMKNCCRNLTSPYLRSLRSFRHPQTWGVFFGRS